MVTVPPPPEPFSPQTTKVHAETEIYRVLSAHRTATEFNPGHGPPTRFGFFGTPIVPVMYGAETEVAAVAETLLHDIPTGGGILPYDSYKGKVLARLEVIRDLKVGVLHGVGLRALKITAEQVPTSPANTYRQTSAWADAAHKHRLDGLVWMSRQCNDAKAYVFFGDRCGDAFRQDVSYGRIFANPADMVWLIDLCAPLHIDILPPGPKG